MSKARKSESSSQIVVQDACENNLQGVTLKLPNAQLVAVAGVSGSGKSSLVHNVIGRIGRRRIGRIRGVLNTLVPSYQPNVESVLGLPPCIEVRQEPLRGQIRSTIATYTGTLDLLASLFEHHGLSRADSGSEVDEVDTTDYAAWLMQHYEGCSATVARITPDMDLSSISQVPGKGAIYYRDRNSNWTYSTRAELKSKLPAKMWIAIPEERPIAINPKTVRRLLRQPSRDWLWVINEDVYIEGDFHRIAKNDAEPFLPLGRRLFSFNSKLLGSGRCEVCQGTGLVRAVSESSLIRDADAPLLQGGLNLPRKEDRFVHLGALDCVLRALLHLNSLPIGASWSRLPSELKQTILHGSGDVLVPELPSGENKPRKAKRPFPGLLTLVGTRSESKGGAAKAFQTLVVEQECTECRGSRYNRSARCCSYRDVSLSDVMTRITVGELHSSVQDWLSDADTSEQTLLSSLNALLSAYVRLNLGYLQLGRSTNTLSGGESQRIRLGLGLALQMEDCCYLLDEPSRGLHARDAVDLSYTIKELCQGNNTVLMVEHNPILLGNADHLIALGPGGGSEGGRVIYQGKPGQYLHQKENEAEEKWQASTVNARTDKISVKNLSVNNVHKASFSLPLGRLTAVVGVSGAGKSSAVLKGLVPAADALLAGSTTPGTCSLDLPKSIRFVEVVAQRMLGQNRRSVVATALGLLDSMRKHFAGLNASKSLGLVAADFSFNSDGACEACDGSGYAKDGFDVETDECCHVCGGHRLAELPLLAQSNGSTIADVLDRPVAELLTHNHPALDSNALERLRLMVELGLGHLQLSRATPTLSAGERQRLGVVRFMARIESHEGQGLLVLDEPTAGLSAADSQRVFRKLAELARTSGHTLVVIEHKLDLLETVDWIIEFGPGGGPLGGRVLFQGSYKKLLRASTPTSDSIVSPNTLNKPLSSNFSQKKSHRTASSPETVRHVGEVFEAFVASQEVREDQRAIHPIHPVISLNSARFDESLRMIELLDLLPLLRKRCQAELPEGVEAVANLQCLEEVVRGRSFGFSPVALQQRLGLVIPQDFTLACTQLCRMGFREIWSSGRCFRLAEAGKQLPSELDITDCWVICNADEVTSAREVAMRWSQGVIRLMDQPEGKVFTTQFLRVDKKSMKLGASLSAPYVGDCRSPSGRCLFCSGTGHLPVYPLDLIIADKKSSISDDKFWHPAILSAIRGLRRTRIIPEARFFSTQSVADFLQPYGRMCDHTVFMFENGIPWRRFLKPNAKRKDRVQDYFSWRGLHDYVYMAMGRIGEKHKQRLKDGFQLQVCKPCQGTGTGWETAYLRANGNTLLDLLGSHPLSSVKKDLRISCPALEAALNLGLGELRLSDRFTNLPDEQRRLLVIAAACSAPLENLSLLIEDVDQLDKRLLSRLLAKQGMSLA